MAQEVNIKIKYESNGQAVMGQLKIAAQDLTAAVAAASKSLDKDIKRMTSALSSTVVALQGMSMAFQQLAEPAMSFDQAMRAANTMADKSGEDFKKLTNQVKGLSKEIPIARDLLANGLYQTISNGVPEDNWMSFLEASARSSVGGLANLEEVVKVTSTVIKNYGYGWEDAAVIQDKIQLTAKNGVTSFEQLAQALPKVTGNAATLGVQIDELMATFSTLTGVSGNTAEVSTQLSAIFTSLIKPSKEAQKMAAAMGIEFNAASIKAAGGLNNFLTSLDEAVKKYAQSNGVLEQAVYGKLFGSAEALRAIGPLVGQLADKYEENVNAMADSAGTMDSAFSFMSDSIQASIQRAKNTIADITDSIGMMAAKALPALQMMATLTIAMTGLKTAMVFVNSIIKAFDMTIRASAVGLKMHNALITASSKIFYSLPKPISGVIARIVGLGNVSRGAALAVRGLATAIKGIMATTVVGLVFAAVTAAIGIFTSKTDDAAESVSEAKREFDDWKKSLTDLSSHTSQAIAKEVGELDRLYKAATDETKSRKDRLAAAEELKKTYKDTFGNLKTEAILAGQAAQAYDKLKSSIIEAAKAEAAKKLAEENQGQWLEKEIRKEQLRVRQSNLKEDLHSARTHLSEVNLSDRSHEIVMRPGMSSLGGSSSWAADNTTDEYRAAKAAVDNLEAERDAISKELDEIEEAQNAITEANSILEKIVTSDTSYSGPSNNLDDLLKGDKGNNDKTYKQQLDAKLADAKDEYIKASIAGNDAEAESIKKVIDRLREQVAEIENIEKLSERPVELDSLQAIDAEINFQQSLRSRAKKEEIAGIDERITELQKMRKAYEQAGKPIGTAETVNTFKELDDAISYYREMLADASEADRADIQLEINKLEELRKKWENVLNELKAPGGLSSLKNADDFEEALSYYQSKLNKASGDDIFGIQSTINAIKKAQEVQHRGVKLADMDSEVKELQELTGKDYTLKIRSMGFETLNGKIKELQKMLNDTKNPMSEAMRKNAENLIQQYSAMKRECIMSFDTLKSGWDNVKGVSSGIQSLTEVVNGNGNAWEKVTSAIDGTIQIYQSVQQIMTIVGALTDVLKNKKLQEKQATEQAAAAEVIASAESIAAKEGEAIAAQASTTENVKEAASGALAAHSSIPFVGIAIGAAMVAAMLATMASLPKFAAGGIAYGPTVGMFGEYPGASNNPEVVAPLDRLRSLIQPQGTGYGKVEFEIDGRKLKGLLRKVDTLSSRS